MRAYLSNIIPLFLLIISLGQNLFAQEIAILKYQGGGDWYANPTALPNLIKFCNRELNMQLKEKPAVVEAESEEIFEFPFIHMTGHGNVYFSERSIDNLRNYLLAGGFLHIDDNYGMEPFIRRELKKLFPEKDLQPLPRQHALFSQHYSFPNGLPKIHEHDGNPPVAYALFDDDRLMLLFTFECDLGDGWESPEVHHDPEEVRLKALQMGANILEYVFQN